MSSETYFYTVLYYIIRFAHYGITPILSVEIINRLFLSKVTSTLCKILLLPIILILTWATTVAFFSGCPFTYAEEHFASKAWGTEKKYQIEDSMAYKAILQHLPKFSQEERND